jgi:hypothetical protein
LFCTELNSLIRMFITLLIWMFVDYKERQNIYVLIRVYLIKKKMDQM